MDEKRTVVDVEEQKRGKRMMGVLLGTLSKFKEESSDPVLQKQRQIQTKLAERLQGERTILLETIERERQERIEQAELEREKWDEQCRTEIEETARQRRINLANFLVTSTAPPLFYLPAVLTEEQQEVIERQCNEALSDQ